VHPYAYANVNFPQPAIWTFGVSYDNLNFGPITEEKVNPKVSVRWNITDDLVLRGAYTQFVRPALVSNQTLEPTQVAGFDQFFDDPNGLVSRRWGVGLDHRLSSNLFVGGEATWRYLDIPVIGGAGTERHFDGDEQTHRTYVHWLPIPEVALSAEFVYDRFETPSSGLTLERYFPRRSRPSACPWGSATSIPAGRSPASA
jgi:hypothetical protein